MPKSTAELNKRKEEILARKEELINGVKTEKRSLNEQEQAEIREMQTELAGINVDIAANQEINKGKGTPVKKQEEFSLRRAIYNQINNRQFHEADAAVIQEGIEIQKRCGLDVSGSIIIPMEERGVLQVGADALGGSTVQTDRLGLLLPLTDRLVLKEAGATILTGLTNDVEIPTYSGTSVQWEEELAKAKDGAGEFDKFKFKPKRISGYVDISKQLLAQDSIGVERLIRETIAGAVALKLESTVFGSHTTKATMPNGFFTTLPEAGGLLDWDKVVKMETDIDTQNALLGNLKYIMHPALIGKSKTTVKKEKGAVGFIYDGGVINGYPVIATNAVAKGLQEGADEYGAIFGNWADFFVGQWGAIDLTVDPYTVATEGKVRIVINAYFDAGMTRKESFSVSTFK